MTPSPRRIEVRADTFFLKVQGDPQRVDSRSAGNSRKEPEAQRDPRARLKKMPPGYRGRRREKSGVTYVVMEGLRLAGVLARLPSVWSRTIQIPEHAATE